MATFTKYNTFVENLCNKLIDAFGTTDTWKAVIHTDAPAPTTDNGVSDLTQIGGSNGYTTGGTDITFNSTRTTDTVTATAVDVVWTASGGNLGSSTTGRYVSIYDDTSTSSFAAARMAAECGRWRLHANRGGGECTAGLNATRWNRRLCC